MRGRIIIIPQNEVKALVIVFSPCAILNPQKRKLDFLINHENFID